MSLEGGGTACCRSQGRSASGLWVQGLWIRARALLQGDPQPAAWAQAGGGCQEHCVRLKGQREARQGTLGPGWLPDRSGAGRKPAGLWRGRSHKGPGSGAGWDGARAQLFCKPQGKSKGMQPRCRKTREHIQGQKEKSPVVLRLQARIDHPHFFRLLSGLTVSGTLAPHLCHLLVSPALGPLPEEIVTLGSS